MSDAPRWSDASSSPPPPRASTREPKPVAPGDLRAADNLRSKAVMERPGLERRRELDFVHDYDGYAEWHGLVSMVQMPDYTLDGPTERSACA